MQDSGFWNLNPGPWMLHPTYRITSRSLVPGSDYWIRMHNIIATVVGTVTLYNTSTPPPQWAPPPPSKRHTARLSRSVRNTSVLDTLLYVCSGAPRLPVKSHIESKTYYQPHVDLLEKQTGTVFPQRATAGICMAGDVGSNVCASLLTTWQNFQDKRI